MVSLDSQNRAHEVNDWGLLTYLKQEPKGCLDGIKVDSYVPNGDKLTQPYGDLSGGIVQTDFPFANFELPSLLLALLFLLHRRDN